MWQISYTSANLQKIQSGYERIFCKNTSVIRVKIRALTVKYSVCQNWQKLFFLTMASLRPFIGLSGHFKLDLLTSDSFYCKGGSENFIKARYYEKVRIKKRLLKQLYGGNHKNTGNFLKTPIFTSVPVFIREGSSHWYIREIDPSHLLCER